MSKKKDREEDAIMRAIYNELRENEAFQEEGRRKREEAEAAANALVPIDKQIIGDDEVNSVNARELHEFLEVKTRFNDWISSRIAQYDFVENQDFITLTENPVSGGKMIEYHISIDMAKELSMVERNEKGKEARQYFIRCEKALKDNVKSIGYETEKVLDRIIPLFERTMQMAKLVGKTPEEARIHAINIVKKATNIDCMKFLALGHITDEIGEIDEKPISFLPLKKIAKSLFADKYMVESFLETMNFHTYVSSSIGYTPTHIGLRHCKIVPTGKTTKDGMPEMQTLWSSEIIEIIENFRLP